MYGIIICPLACTHGLVYGENILRYWSFNFGPLPCNFIYTRQWTKELQRNFIYTRQWTKLQVVFNTIGRMMMVRLVSHSNCAQIPCCTLDTLFLSDIFLLYSVHVSHCLQDVYCIHNSRLSLLSLCSSYISYSVISI